MAKLKKAPSQAIIDGFKGVIDYYFWLGLPCVRMWPIWKRRNPWPDELENQNSFSYAASMWQFLPTYLKDSYNRMAVSTNVTGRDIFTRGYLNAGRPKT